MKYAICIENKDYEACLEKRKLYQIVEDKEAESLKQLRIIDEEGEDYLYSSKMFLVVDLPLQVVETLEAIA